MLGSKKIKKIAMIDVLIVEDDEELRRNFSDIVQHHIQMNLVSSVATCRKAINHLRQLNPDVLLVDLGLPDGDGIDVIKTITSNNLKTEALVVTIFGDENHVIQALEAGAVGYILKDEKNDEIANYILQMINGGAPVSPAIARHMLKRFKSETDVDKTTGLEILTNKENPNRSKEILFARAYYVAQMLKRIHNVFNPGQDLEFDFEIEVSMADLQKYIGIDNVRLWEFEGGGGGWEIVPASFTEI